MFSQWVVIYQSNSWLLLKGLHLLSRLETRIKECIRVKSILVLKTKRMRNESKWIPMVLKGLCRICRSEFFWRIWAKLILIQPERWWSLLEKGEAWRNSGGGPTGVLTCKLMLIF